jgi:hypothetical protein
MNLTACFYGGLVQGLTFAGQPISIVLSIICAAAILFAGIVLARVRVLPLWGKVVVALLAIYGIAAFVLAVKSGTPYVQLFHGGSEWNRLPWWLQGASVGTLFVIPLAIVLELVNTVAHKGGKLSGWLVNALLLGICFAIAIMAIRTVPQAGTTAAMSESYAVAEPGTTSSESAVFSEAGSSSQPALTLGDYATGQQSGPAAAKNQTATLTVPKFQIVSSLGEQQAPVRHAFLVLSTVWKNTGPAQYLIPDVVNHLFLLIDGERQATLSDASAAAPHRLPTDQLVIPATGDDVSGEYVYAIPDHGVTSVELLFIDTDKGDMHLTLFGSTPPMLRTIAGPANNGLIEAGVLGTEEVSALGSTQAPPGQKYAVIAVRMRGLSKGNLVRFDATKYPILRDADGYSYPVSPVADLDDEFTSATQLLPEIPCRGMLAFLVPAAHSALTLALNLPGYNSMELALPNTGGSAHIGKPLLSIEDGDTLTLSVLGLRRESSIGSNTAASGKSYLVLDILFTSKVDQGIEFQTAEQLILLDGDNQIAADADALDALPHPLKENSVISPHGQARFEVAYQVPAAASHFAIRYRGFQMETKESLPEVPANGHGG